MYISRTIEPKIKKSLFKGKIIIIYGPRQVGKTTLVKKIAKDSKIPYLFLNCDENTVRDLFIDADSVTRLSSIIGDNKLIIIDEAQRIKDIGLKLKLLIDNFPKIQVIATGSSSFELADKISEPLTGRGDPYFLYPFSLKEISSFWSRLEIVQNLESLLIYGCYPAAVLAKSALQKEKETRILAGDNLYRDVIKFQDLKASETAKKLLAALSLQTGSEVSFQEIGLTAQISRPTAEIYTDILGKAFIVYKTTPFSRNLRSELNKMNKIYFWDNGIRNAIINAFNPLELRADIGALWENFVIGEIRKKQIGVLENHPLYFWRTYDRQEIDLVEEVRGKLSATEIKWQKIKKQPPKAWRDNYPKAKWTGINKDNFLEYLL